MRAKPDDLVGSVLGGRYSVEKELGRGGIGAVYLARDKPELHSRRVVVKVLLEDSLRNEWVVQKFRQEIESLTRLEDPGVVGIFDAGTLPDGAPYLVMQYVDGSSLRAEIRPGGMDMARAADIIRQMGRTLSAAHDEGIIHRDLKPENIMLRRAASGEEHVKVIDFGIAKVKDSAIAPSTETGAGIAGTILYMSPEQLTAQKITPASDIYALGIIAYEMLTGIRPFNPETKFQLLVMQKCGVQALPRALRPGIPEAAQKVILKALSYDPAARPRRAKDFSDDLARALSSEDGPYPPDGSRGKAKLWPKKGRDGARRTGPQLWMLAALVLLIASAVGLLLWRKSGAGTDRQAAADGATTITTAATAGRSLTYSLTVQRMNGGVPAGEEFPATGQETFGNGWRFRVNITPAQSGSLYMLNEFNARGDTVNYNALFPTKENNGGVAQIAADRKWQTGWYHFPHKSEGAEKFWIVWSKTPLDKLDAVFKDAANHDLVISDPEQVSAVRDVLSLYNSSRPEMETDAANRQITLKGRGDILVNLLELRHEKK